jgi:ribosomal protein S18 acetylase RimI-like enzyme
VTSHVLAGLPPRWQADRLLLSDRSRWAGQEAYGDDDGVLLVVRAADLPGVSLLGRGAGPVVDRLVADVAGRHDLVRWMSVPRASRPAPDVLDALGLVPFSAWDWMSCDAAPPSVAGEDRVERLDPVRDAVEIRACLTASNPGTSADPEAPGEIGWWGVRDGTTLTGVVGVTGRGATAGRTSWHLHGLGVRAEARGSGLGSALTAAATRAGLADGAEWVGLGIYASNDVARRLYHRLGYRTHVEMASFAPESADRPPA